MIETWGFRVDISLMLRIKMSMKRRRSRATRMTTRRTRRIARRRTMTITKLPSVLRFLNQRLKPN